jgi:hypothetical protein
MADDDAPAFVDRLRVHVTAVDPATALATIAWLTPAAGRVSVRRSTLPPPWPAGTRLSRAEAETWGEPLAGDRLAQGRETQIAATVRSGPQVYLPFTYDASDTATVGEPVAVGVAAPVERLRAARTGREVAVSWDWPPAVEQVEVAFLPERGKPYRRRVTRGRVARFPAGASGGTVSVRAVTRGQVGDLFSVPRTVAVEPVATVLEYHLPRAGGMRGRGRRLLRVRVDQECTDVDLELVVAEGDAMPARPENGRTVQRFTGLRLDPDTPWEVPFTVPRAGRPYWLRCFVLRPAGIRVVDPIDEMKVS